MEIKIIGSGCPKCQRLHEMVLGLKKSGKIPESFEIEYSKDVNELAELGAMGSPGLVVNGKLAYVGMPGSEESLIEAIKRYSK